MKSLKNIQSTQTMSWAGSSDELSRLEEFEGQKRKDQEANQCTIMPICLVESEKSTNFVAW